LAVKPKSATLPTKGYAAMAVAEELVPFDFEGRTQVQVRY